MSMIPKRYINAVVAIGVRNERNEITWIATGFLLGRKVNDDRIRPFLVTNKHVLQDKTSVVIRLRVEDTQMLRDEDAPVINTDGTPKYKLHPNANIDIAVLPLNAEFIIDNHLEFPYYDIDHDAMTSTELTANGVDAGTLVYMLGFPMGLVNENSDMPICRLGCIGRICEAQINENHNILLDIQNFPGNSGSPIVTKPEVGAIQGTPNLNRSVLVGIAHSSLIYKDELVSRQLGSVVEVRTENSGIAQVHPVEYIREVIDEIMPRINPENNH